MGCARRSYQPRHAETSVLHGVIRDHADDFLRAAAERADGAGLPERLLRRSRALWWELPPLASTDALMDIGHKLGSAPDPEMAIEARHVLMGRGVAQAETIRDLLLAVPL
jgi:hypothetical protein